MSNKKVLLTGVTGFLDSHTTIQLINKGFDVIGTLRIKDRMNSIKEIISKYTSNRNSLAWSYKIFRLCTAHSFTFSRKLRKHEN